MNRILGFFIQELNHEDSFISGFFKKTLTCNSSYMLVNINSILKRYNIKYMDLFSMDKSDVKRIIKCSTLEPDWRSNIIKERLCLGDPKLCNLVQTEVKKM